MVLTTLLYCFTVGITSFLTKEWPVKALPKVRIHQPLTQMSCACKITFYMTANHSYTTKTLLRAKCFINYRDSIHYRDI